MTDSASTTESPAASGTGAGDLPAQTLLRIFEAAAAKNPAANFNPSAWTPAMGDIPKPQNMFSASILGEAWPTESESAMGHTASELNRQAEKHQTAAENATAATDNVFANSSTDGVGAGAAAHYQAEHAAHQALHTATHRLAT